MIFTVADARSIVAPFTESGACPTSQTVLDRINECSRRLAIKANWWNLTHRIRFNTSNNTITLPREADHVIRVNTCGAPARMFNQAYEFLEGGPGELTASDGYSTDLLDLGSNWPIFFDIPEDTPSRLVAFSTELADEGQNLTIWGKDAYAAEICGTAGVPGVSLPIMRWQDGVEGTVQANNIGTRITTQSFKEITSVAKPVTKGNVCLYTYDPDDHRMYFLCKYHPDETRPNYHRYRITAPGFSDKTNVLCLVKLAYVPAVRDTDILLIQNLDAYKLMAMAIREENDRNVQVAEAYEQKAVRVLSEEHASRQTTNDVLLQINWDYGLGRISNQV